MDDFHKDAIISAVRRADFKAAIDGCNAYLAATGRLEAHYLLGSALLGCGQASLASQFLAVLCKAAPGDDRLSFDYGCACHALERLPDAISAWRRTLDLAPDRADACRNLAMGLLDSGRDGEAARALHRLLRLEPDSADALLHLGNIRWRAGDQAGALDLYRRTVEMAPGEAAGWTNTGEALADMGRAGEAEIALRRAVQAEPNNQPAHFNLATFLLKERRWAEGFAEFRWRANRSMAPPGIAALPAWDGRRAGAGTERIGLWNDQGFGDGIQFLRFVPVLDGMGWKPVLLMPRQLARLAAGLAGPVEVHPFDAPPPPLDCQAALADLPHLLGLCQPEQWWSGPYLSAQPASPRPDDGGLRVGLVWAGNAANKLGLNRRVSLAALAPLLAIRGIAWFSLQLGPEALDLNTPPWAGRIEDLSPGLADFADTAAAISGLDLVITVDTSVAHLAGALGRPVWIMLPERCDWRWLSSGETTPWYPTARLFRRRPGLGWSDVAETIATALAAWRDQGAAVCQRTEGSSTWDAVRGSS